MLQENWTGSMTLHLALEASPHRVSRPTGLQTVEYGVLVFSLPIETEYCRKEYTRKGVERKFPYCDYALIPKSEWRYGFGDGPLYVNEHEIGPVPFSAAEPPLTISANLAPVQWEWADGYDTVPAVVPVSNRVTGPARTMKLIPYDCAKLRMTKMPKLHK